MQLAVGFLNLNTIISLLNCEYKIHLYVLYAQTMSLSTDFDLADVGYSTLTVDPVYIDQCGCEQAGTSSMDKETSVWSESEQLLIDSFNQDGLMKPFLHIRKVKYQGKGPTTSCCTDSGIHEPNRL